MVSTSPGGPAYDRIGRGYGERRRADPRIGAQIAAALGDSRTVLNVGAGTGSYEPADREVTAVEPSAEMIGQRPPGAAPVVQAGAESLPFDDDSFDAAMALLSDHHWRDREAGLREMLRVARRRVLLLNADPGLAPDFWLTQDYLPGFIDLIPEAYRRRGRWGAELRELLGARTRFRVVPVAHDCTDGFYAAFWRRPHAYLDPEVRSGISVFHALPSSEVEQAIETLRRDLDQGRWDRRHRRLLEEAQWDVGLRLVICESGARG